MSRKHFSRKIKRATDRYLRNEGPKAFRKAADNELKTKAAKMAAGLSKATIRKGSAAAAGLLVELAESVEYNENPAAFERAFSLADKWAGEPQVVPIDIIRPLIEDQPQPLQLTDGQKDDPEATAEPAEDGSTGPPNPAAADPGSTGSELSIAGSGYSPGLMPPARPEIVEAVYE